MRIGLASCALLSIVALSSPAVGKLCPFGRFAVVPGGTSVAGAEAMTLRLNTGGATLEEGCPSTRVRPRVFPNGVQFRLRARWRRPCGSAGIRSLRARFEGCDAMAGTLRTRHGGRLPFTAARISQCGNGVIEAGETCDDRNLVRDDCCSGDCQIEPGCAAR